MIAWCAFDYASLLHSYNGVKCPGVADVFRIPKLGASFYRAQIDPRIRAVIEPSFYWDFGSHSPSGPGSAPPFSQTATGLNYLSTATNMPHCFRTELPFRI